MAVDVMLPPDVNVVVATNSVHIQKCFVLTALKMAGSEQEERLRGPTVLEDCLSVYPKSSIRYRVALSRDDVTITPTSVTRRRPSVAGHQVPGVVALKDVTGCHLLKNRDRDVSVAYFCIYFYPYRKKILGKKCRQRQTVTFMVNTEPNFVDNKYRATQWKTAISYLCRKTGNDDRSCMELPPKTRHLVLLNPFSGSGKAMHVYEQSIKTMFLEAEMDYKLVVTERANHARDMMLDLPLNQYDGIIILSGDGLVHEVLNGLVWRTDWERAVKIPIGVVPVGSGNALAASVTYRAGESYASHFIQHCTFVLLKHVVSPMDLMLIESGSSRMVSFLSVTWGFVADVDIESEKFRKLGSARFLVSALMRILSLKKYRGRLSFLPNKPYVSRQRSRGNNALKRSLTTSDDCLAAADNAPKRVAKCTSLPHLAYRSRTISQATQDDESDQCVDLQAMTPDSPDESTNVTDRAPANDRDDSNDTTPTSPTSNRCLAKSTLPPLGENVPDDWVTLEDEFIMVTATSLSHLSSDFITHPDVTWNDGLMTLCVIRADVSKAQMLSIMSAMEDGSHITNPNIEFIQCEAFRLEPLTPSGCIAVDGELVEYGPLQAQVLPSCARIMTASES